jgi:hypothetical protein
MIHIVAGFVVSESFKDEEQEVAGSAEKRTMSGKSDNDRFRHIQTKRMGRSLPYTEYYQEWIPEDRLVVQRERGDDYSSGLSGTLPGVSTMEAPSLL